MESAIFFVVIVFLAQHYFTHIQGSMDVNHIVDITMAVWTIEREGERGGDSPTVRVVSQIYR